MELQRSKIHVAIHFTNFAIDYIDGNHSYLPLLDLHGICTDLIIFSLERGLVYDAYLLFVHVDHKLAMGLSSEAIHPVLQALFSIRSTDRKWFSKAEKLFHALSREKYYPPQDYPNLFADNCYLMIERSFTNADIYMVIVMYMKTLFERWAAIYNIWNKKGAFLSSFLTLVINKSTDITLNDTKLIISCYCNVLFSDLWWLINIWCNEISK